MQAVRTVQGSRGIAGVALGLLVALVACKNSGVRDENRVERAGALVEVDLPRTTKPLDCDKAAAGSPKGEACRIAKDFAAATPLSAWPSSGRDVWYGRTYRIVSGKADNVSPYFFQVQPGSGDTTSLSPDELKFVLPVNGSARDLIPENASERADADALLAAVMASKPIADSPAVTFMRTAEPTNGYRALAHSTGASAVIVAKFRAYIRQHGQRLVMLEPHAEGGGWFSELWKLP